MIKIRLIIFVIVAVTLAIISGYFIWDYFQPASPQESESDKDIKIEIVDQDGWVGIDSNIVLDSNGNPHICHYDQGSRDLKYARKVNDLWQKEAVDTEGDVGEECGLAIDQEGHPHISYEDASEGNLKYAKRKDGDWLIEKIDRVEGYRPMSTSLALNDKGYPRIAYSLAKIEELDQNKQDNQPASYLKYAVWNGSSWQSETITNGGTDVYLALDSKDQPHLSFKKEEENGQNKERITYATKKNGQWSIEVVDRETLAGGDTGLAIDSQDRAHLVYNDYGNQAKKYAYFSNGAWQIQTVGEKTGNGEGSKIALDSSGRPSLVYNDGRQEKIVLAKWDGSSWTKKVIDSMGNPSLAIDHWGRIHISYGHSVGDKDNRFVAIRQQTGEEEIEILKYALVERPS